MLKCSGRDCLSLLKQNKLLLATIFGITVGTIIGIALRPLEPSYTVISWIKIWGELFLRMFKVIILPLVLSCLVVAITSLEGKASGKLGIFTLLYILCTTLVASTIGIVLCLTIQPGARLAETATTQGTKEITSYTDVFTDFLRNMVPDNIVSASFQTVYTELKEETNSKVVNSTNQTDVITTRTLRHRYGINTLGIVTIAITLALGIQRAGAKAKPLKDVFQALYHVVFTIVKGMLWYSPFGVGCLVAGAFLSEKNLTTAFNSLGLFVLTFSIGFVIHAFVLMPFLFLVIVRKNPFKHYANVLEGILAGFASANSATAMTFLLKDCEKKMDVKSELMVFVLPMLTVLNRDGSAMFICSAMVFVAQSHGIFLSIGDVCTIGGLVSLLSTSVANIPSGSIVIIMMVCSSVNIPINERLGLLLAVEWLLDRLRTTNNVIGNAFGCAVIPSTVSWFSKTPLVYISDTEAALHVPESNQHVSEGKKALLVDSSLKCSDTSGSDCSVNTDGATGV